jgi:hypothetical protein
MIIQALSDDTLLNIFRRYMDAAPQFWHMLASVCERWRQIVFTSPLGLNLRLYCTYGTPVSRTLDYWPALPMIVQYGGLPNLDPPAPEDDDNIIAALKQSGRVCSIGLTVTSSLLAKLSAISEPFSELEELALMSRDSLELIFPNTFRLGPHLRTLHSTRIAFPSFPQLLSPSHDLVDLQLHEIPNVGYFPPDAFANALSDMTQLEKLSLHFLSLPSRRNFVGLPPQPGERIVLPALTCLKYRGTSKYLDSFVARIDAPRLGDIDITFFSQPTMDASQLGRFIERIEMQTSFSKADVETSVDAISISFTNSSTSTPLRLQVSCKQLDWQLSSITQICNQFSPFLFRVEDLAINTTRPSGKDDVDGEQWLELVRAFGGAKDFRVASELAIYTLHPTDTAMFPALRNLHLQEPTSSHVPGPLWDLVESFVTQRRLSSCPVQVFTPWAPYSCQNCIEVFKHQEDLDRHTKDKHLPPNVCPYCDDFDWPQGRNNIFQEHLASKHPGVTHTDALISNPVSRPFFSSDLGSTQLNRRLYPSNIFGRAPVTKPEFSPEYSPEHAMEPENWLSEEDEDWDNSTLSDISVLDRPFTLSRR